MRLISNFHDYYDGAIQYSKEPFYNRKRESHMQELPWTTGSKHGQSIVIGFCGRLYPMVKARDTFFEPENIETEWHNFDDKDLVNMFGLTWQPRRYNNPEYNKAHFIESCKKYFEAFATKSPKKIQDYFDSFNCPIFSCIYDEYGRWEITKNCRLADFRFYRKFDTWTAAQEIEMYLNNIAWPNKPIPEVSNKDLISSKGFDKYSFRKDKQN